MSAALDPAEVAGRLTKAAPPIDRYDFFPPTTHRLMEVRRILQEQSHAE